MTRRDTDALVIHAATALGRDEEVLAAGLFGIDDPAIGPVGGPATPGAPIDQAAVTLIVAVTATRIHVLDDGTTGPTPELIASFDRATCEITGRTLGLARRFHLADPTTGHEMTLSGSRLSKPDQLVMQLLAA